MTRVCLHRDEVWNYTISERDLESLRAATTIEAWILSCPDYGDRGLRATFDQLGSGTPVMVKQLGAAAHRTHSHLSANRRVAMITRCLIADTEGRLPHLRDQFNIETSSRFSSIVSGSKHASADYLHATTSSDEVSVALFSETGDPQLGLDMNLGSIDDHAKSWPNALTGRLRRAIRWRETDHFYQEVASRYGESYVRQLEMLRIQEYLSLGDYIRYSGPGEHIKAVFTHASPHADLLNFPPSAERIVLITRERRPS